MKKFRIKFNRDLLNIQWAWENVSYTKVIIPENAILDLKKLKKYWYKIIDHKKFKTVEEILKTKSQSTSYFAFDYNLKNIDCNKQSFKIYKQAWIYNYDILFDYNNFYTNKTEKLKFNWLEKDFYYNLVESNK
jgi:hypothetical protein